MLDNVEIKYFFMVIATKAILSSSQDKYDQHHYITILSLFFSVFLSNFHSYCSLTDIIIKSDYHTTLYCISKQRIEYCMEHNWSEKVS